MKFNSKIIGWSNILVRMTDTDLISWGLYPDTYPGNLNQGKVEIEITELLGHQKKELFFAASSSQSHGINISKTVY